MTQLPQQGGASVQARGRIPSTDLASLVKFIEKAYPPEEKREGLCRAWPVLSYDATTRRLGINTYGFLRRLLANPDFLDSFKNSDETGFLRDAQPPSKGFTAKMGGKVFQDNFGGIASSITTLKKDVEEQLASLEIDANSIIVPNPEQAFGALAEATGLRDFLEPQAAKLQAIEFAKSERPVAAREKDVARVISAEEEIQAEDWLERLSNSIADAQADRDVDFSEVQREKLVETLRQDFDKTDSQVTRFLNFLEDQALARVRLAVSFAIMQALATQAATSQDATELVFVAYVQKVLGLFELYGAPEAEDSLQFELSREYGLAADFSASDELVKAMFYNCLPVWAEWNTQLFESRRVDSSSKGVSVLREVSYRFRVNGKDPRNEMLHAFDSRLERLSQVLLDSESDNQPSAFRVRRGISEITFLWLVLNSAITPGNLKAEAEALAKRLKQEGRAGLAALMKDLKGWSAKVKGLSSTLFELLRTKSRKVVSHAQRAIDDLYLVVQQSIVDWAAVERSRGKVRDPLVKANESASDDVEWFRHIKVAKRPDEVVQPLFSVRVRTALHERTLAAREDNCTTVHTVRELPNELLNIVWLPIETDTRSTQHTFKLPANVDPTWGMGGGIDVLYDPELLRERRDHEVSNPDKRANEESRRQYRTAAISALAVLVYVVLQVVAERINKEKQTRVSALMMRFQKRGKEASSFEGDPLIYAAAQAVESALMREMPIRMQGIVTTTGNQYYKQRGTAFALASAFPLVVETGAKPGVDKLAVIVYATRPCDDHPEIKDADGFVFRAKTYLAEATEAPFVGYRFSFERMQSHVVESSDTFKSPHLIVEEVSRLNSLGYEHIILISNHFGNRRINRSAQRHSPHTQTSFLDEVAAKFANVSLYTLRRDVFPATRLHLRGKGESAFEAVRLDDHNEFALSQGDGVLKQLIPAFTFATLAIVGNDEAARPQSGFCTYFLDTDYQVRNVEWRERVRANILSNATGVRLSILAALRGLHFLEGEKQPEGGVVKPVLDPFGWVRPSTSGSAGEIAAIPASRRKGDVVLSLPALLSHVTDALHRGRG